MSKSENIQIHKYLTRPARPQLPAARSERQLFARGTTLASQLPVEDYVTIVREMVADPNYRPTDVNINFKETGPIPNFLKAKEIVKQEMGDGFTQAYERNINRNRKIRAKEKRKIDPELKARYSASRAETRGSGRIKKLGGDVKMTPNEKFLNFQQRLIEQQLNQKIKQNPDIILKNEALMDQMSTTVSENGDIIKVKPNLTDIKNRGVFEIEHQRDIYKTGKMKDFPYNRNLILGPYNRKGGFKESAEKFIEKFPDPSNPKVQAILEKADELGVTIRPNVPEGTFSTKALGYKQAGDPIKKFIEAAKKVTPALASNDLGIPSYTKDIDMAKKALGVKELKSELFPGARATGEFISGMAEDVASKSYGKLAFKSLGALGVGYGIYDAGVAFQEGKSVPEMAFRLVGVDPLYNTIEKYRRLPEDAQEIQKKINAQQSFDMSQSEMMDEGLVGMRGRPEVTEEEKMYLNNQYQIVEEKIKQEDKDRAEGRSGILNMIRQKVFDVTGQRYSVAFANGGRVFLEKGGKPKNFGRRRFLKFTGQGITLLGTLPFLGKFIKPIAKEAPEMLEVISRSADNVPDYLLDLIGKVKMMGKSKILGKADNPDGFVQYDLGEYTVVDSASSTRIKKTNYGSAGDEIGIKNELEMEIRKDPETGALEYDEVEVFPDAEGKMKEVEFGIEDSSHQDMKKFTYED
jgi:hypothetical protein